MRATRAARNVIAEGFFIEFAWVVGEMPFVEEVASRIAGLPGFCDGCNSDVDGELFSQPLVNICLEPE